MKHKLKYKSTDPVRNELLLNCVNPNCFSFVLLERKTWYEMVVNRHDPYKNPFFSRSIRNQKWVVCRG